MNPGQLLIVRARPDQAAILTSIAHAAKRHWGYPERWIEIWRPQLSFSAEFVAANEVWAAVEAGNPVAFYALGAEGQKATLEDLWVHPEAMGRGIGAGLFAHACERARELGYKILTLDADPNAVGFYEHMGGHKVGERIGEVDSQPRILPILEFEL